MLNVQNADVYTDFNGLANLKTQAKNDPKGSLQQVAKQFESIFINNVLKSMREAKLADGAMDNDQSQFYKEMYDQQLAIHLSGKPGVGLADLIVRQLGNDNPEDHKKLALEDYLNRSSGSVKAVAHRSQDSVRRLTPHHDGVMTIKPYEGDYSKLPAISVIPLKNEDPAPIRSAEDFVKQLHPFAEEAARQLGVEPKVIIAQAALETGWGRSLLKNSDGSSSFNLFNIKAGKSWQGKQAQASALEVDQGIAKKVNAGFRSYGSFQESLQDYVRFIKSNPRYGDALKQAGNAEQYTRELQQAGYATDPDYADKIMSIYHSDAISEFKPDLIASMTPVQDKFPLKPVS
ncbi:MAG: flagellar assembly peptidoglycan hydrolase FlgJ [Methylococcaceae bacterium]|nr:flagellar assembly peptidoglycan hydrolase FlgJ [Methylococcaceae bacterium]